MFPKFWSTLYFANGHNCCWPIRHWHKTGSKRICKSFHLSRILRALHASINLQHDIPFTLYIYSNIVAHLTCDSTVRSKTFFLPRAYGVQPTNDVSSCSSKSQFSHCILLLMVIPCICVTCPNALDDQILVITFQGKHRRNSTYCQCPEPTFFHFSQAIPQVHNCSCSQSFCCISCPSLFFRVWWFLRCKYNPTTDLLLYKMLIL